MFSYYLKNRGPESTLTKKHRFIRHSIAGCKATDHQEQRFNKCLRDKQVVSDPLVSRYFWLMGVSGARDSICRQENTFLRFVQNACTNMTEMVVSW